MTRVSPGALARHSRELAALLGMGHGLVEALARVRERAGAPFAAVASRLEDSVRRGETLGAALDGVGSAVPACFVRAVKVGEATGDLPRALQGLADLLERAEWRRAGVRAALAYPRLLITVGVALAFLVAWLGGLVVGGAFHGTAVDPPAATLLALRLSSFFLNPVVVGLALLLLAAFHVVVTGSVGTARLRLSIPVLGSWLRRQETVTCLDWLDFLLAHRLPLDEALRVAADACSPGFREGVLRMADGVSRGGSLSVAGVFPETAAWLVSQAEQREFPPGLLGRIARTLQREVDLTSRRGLAILEPLALLALGTALAFLLLGYFLPLYHLIGTLG